METTGKVVFSTSKGPITIELWCKQFPQSTRRFLQNCLDGHFDSLPFAVGDDRIQIERDTQYTLPDEHHSRIRWTERGMVGCLKDTNTGKSSADGFFISTAPMPHYNNRYNLIGRVVDSQYTLVAIKDSEHAVKIDSIQVLEDFFGLKAQKADKNEEAPQRKRVKRVRMDYEGDDDDGFQMKSLHELKGLKERKGTENEVQGIKNMSEDVPENRQKDSISSQDDSRENEKTKGTEDDSSKEKTNGQESKQTETTQKRLQQTETTHKRPQQTEEIQHPKAGHEKSIDPPANSKQTQSKKSEPAKKNRYRISLRRDLNVDPKYNPYLDFSDGECDVNALTSHHFGA